jgi:hypothetical protein
MASGRGPIAGYAAAVNVDAAHGPTRHAYELLRFTFAVAPILAGLDKFFHLLANWDMYLCPLAERVLRGHGHTFMQVAGVIEVIAGIGVALMPRVFGWIVAVWLWLIIINLLLCHTFYDIALRDFGLSLAAVALARIAEVYHRPTAKTTLP